MRAASVVPTEVGGVGMMDLRTSTPILSPRLTAFDRV